MSRINVYGELAWDRTAEQMRINSRFVGLAVGAQELGASVHELLPGSTGYHLHAHYGMEELFVVLSGRPTLRTPKGEEPLEPGDVVFCPRGPDGMHTFTNPTAEPARVLALSTLPSPEVVVYPEIGKMGVATRNPLVPLPDGADPGIVGVFDLPT